jgi:hypothetical protein
MNQPAEERAARLRTTNNSHRATIKTMGSALRWLIGSSTAIVMWTLYVWAERAHIDRQERKTSDAGRPPPPPRRR